MIIFVEFLSSLIINVGAIAIPFFSKYFNIIYKYTGETPDYRVDENSNIVQTILPGYNWMDITVTQLFWKNRIEITAGGKNLFDLTTLNFSNGGGGGVHAGSGTNIISWGRTWFVKCKINI